MKIKSKCVNLNQNHIQWQCVRWHVKSRAFPFGLEKGGSFLLDAPKNFDAPVLWVLKDTAVCMFPFPPIFC